MGAQEESQPGLLRIKPRVVEIAKSEFGIPFLVVQNSINFNSTQNENIFQQLLQKAATRPMNNSEVKLFINILIFKQKQIDFQLIQDNLNNIVEHNTNFVQKLMIIILKIDEQKFINCLKLFIKQVPLNRQSLEVVFNLLQVLSLPQ